MKQGDLEPDLVIDITGPGADLNDVFSWRVIGQLRGQSTLLFDDTDPTVDVDPTDVTVAVVTHTWVDGQTAATGLVLLEVEALWPGGRKQTFPSNGQASIRITDDLDP